MDIHVIDMTGDQPKESTIKMPQLPGWSMAKAIGYKPKTTFWRDFSIADLSGPEAIIDTFERAFREWRTDVEYLTELVLVLNHKGCYWHNVGVDRGETEDNKLFLALRDLYFELYHLADDWAVEHLKGEDYEYYYRITD